MTSTPPSRSIGQFVDYFDDKKIIAYLCRVRATLAQRRGKIRMLSQISTDPKRNQHKEALHFGEFEQRTIERLRAILPPRRLWVSIGERKDMNGVRGEGRRLRFKRVDDVAHERSSLDRNRIALEKTVWKHLNSDSTEEFVRELRAFIAELKAKVSSQTYVVAPPKVVPSPKKDPRHDRKGTCRPIALYGLEDRVVLSIANRYLTELFDSLFLDCAFAFRGTSPVTGRRPTHHDAVAQLVRASAAANGKPLWVAECDIKKFYDSVMHSTVRESYVSMLSLVAKEQPELNFDCVTSILESYLKSYAFNENVDRLGDPYWQEQRLKRGRFEWVAPDLKDIGVDPNPEVNRIGVPQGGALSGLIANLVFHETDKAMMRLGYGLYVRYCDDMVIVAETKEQCATLVDVYKTSVKNARLIVHEFEEISNSDLKSYWDTKSKGPFAWGESESEIRWVGFVGYEVNRKGEVRARKKSLKKEVRKQRRIVRDVRKACGINRDLKALTNGQSVSPAASSGSVMASVCQTLVGMAVGRVHLWNRKTAIGDLSWRNGFRMLNDCGDVRKQMKLLDRSRNALVYNLELDFELRDQLIAEMQETDGNPNSEEEVVIEDREMVRFDKPYSYFYHVVERTGRKSSSAA